MNTPRNTTIPQAVALLLAGFCLWLASCAEPTWTVAPLGTHEAQVGSVWRLALRAEGIDSGALTWALVQAPPGLALSSDAGGPHLSWTPTSFDLGPVGPGKPRTQGAMQALAVDAVDARGTRVRAAGQLRAVPVPMLARIQAPAVADIHLEVSSTTRFSVYSQRVAAGLASWSVIAPKGLQCQVLGTGGETDTVRCRVEDAAVAEADSAAVVVQVEEGGDVTASSSVRIAWSGRSHWHPCASTAPSLSVDLQAQVGAHVAHLRGTGIWSVQAGKEAWVWKPQATVLLDISNDTQDLSVAALGSGDPWWQVCPGSARWPEKGQALLGAGQVCASPVLPQDPPLGWPMAADLVACPDRARVLTAPVSGVSSDAAWIRLSLATPSGWPDAQAEVLGGDGSSCRVREGHPCVVATGPAPMSLSLLSTAPTSVHLATAPASGPCSASEVTAAPPNPDSSSTRTLCPAEFWWWQTTAAGRLEVFGRPGSAWLRWQRAGGPWRTGTLTGQGATDIIPAGASVWVGHHAVEPAEVKAVWSVAATAEPAHVVEPYSFLIGDRWPSIAIWALEQGDELALMLSSPATAPGLASWPAGLPAGMAQWAAPKAAEEHRPVLITGPGKLALELAAAPLRTEWSPPPVEVTDSCQDRLTGAAPLEVPWLEGTRLPSLRICPGPVRQIHVAVTADAWLEVSASSPQALSMTVVGADGQVCPSLAGVAGPAPAGALPARRQRAACWLRAGGTATIAVESAVAQRWDLAVRQR